ncbi:MAG: peptidylprolyl isomerase [Melioribacteraceae bacterium]|nr:peptidylprolyl isomerase [Melioribacteraceae bacterium]
MKRFHYSITALLLFITIQSTHAQNSDVLAEFSGQEIKIEEFTKAYQKNAGNIFTNTSGETNMKDFLNLYVNYKMKLKDAEDRGITNDPALEKEYIDYKKQVGASYIIENNIIKPGIRKLYNDTQYDYHVKHVMFKGDSAITNAATVLEQIKTGKISFEEAAFNYTIDNITKADSGDIGFISTGIALPAFEKAALSLEVGEVYPAPVQSRAGVHLIKLESKIPTKKQVRVSHILIRDPAPDGTDVDDPFKKAEGIRQNLLDGADFAEMAKAHSADLQSAEKGGDLGYIRRRLTVKEFDEAAFSLEVDEISDIVKTRYGYHILKVSDIKRPGPFEVEEDELKKVFQTKYYDDYLRDYFDSLKTVYNFTLNDRLIDSLISHKDSIQFNSSGKKYWVVNKNLESVVFSADGMSMNLDSLFTYAMVDDKFKHRRPNEEMMDKLILEYGSKELLKLEAMELDKKDKRFSDLMSDYEKGIYIFKLQELEVWNQLEIDTNSVYEFYLANKENYKFPSKVDFSEIYARKDSLINFVYDKIEAGMPFDSAAVKYTERDQYRDQAGRYPIMEVATNRLAATANQLEKPGDYTKAFFYGGGWFILKLNEKIPSRIKTFDEARSEVIGHYQESETKRLEAEYISRLKEKYNPKYYYDNLKNVKTPE